MIGGNEAVLGALVSAAASVIVDPVTARTNGQSYGAWDAAKSVASGLIAGATGVGLTQKARKALDAVRALDKHSRVKDIMFSAVGGAAGAAAGDVLNQGVEYDEDTDSARLADEIDLEEVGESSVIGGLGGAAVEAFGAPSENLSGALGAAGGGSNAAKGLGGFLKDVFDSIFGGQIEKELNDKVDEIQGDYVECS